MTEDANSKWLCSFINSKKPLHARFTKELRVLLLDVMPLTFFGGGGRLAIRAEGHSQSLSAIRDAAPREKREGPHGYARLLGLMDVHTFTNSLALPAYRNILQRIANPGFKHGHETRSL